jgi:hypothetical protein
MTSCCISLDEISALEELKTEVQSIDEVEVCKRNSDLGSRCTSCTWLSFFVNRFRTQLESPPTVASWVLWHWQLIYQRTPSWRWYHISEFETHESYGAASLRFVWCRTVFFKLQVVHHRMPPYTSTRISSFLCILDCQSYIRSWLKPYLRVTIAQSRSVRSTFDLLDISLTIMGTGRHGTYTVTCYVVKPHSQNTSLTVIKDYITLTIETYALFQSLSRISIWCRACRTIELLQVSLCRLK